MCLPLQASLAPHLRVGGGQRAQAAAADNTPGRAGKWQGKGRLLISLQHGLSPGPWAAFHLGCLFLVALVTIPYRHRRGG